MLMVTHQQVAPLRLPMAKSVVPPQGALFSGQGDGYCQYVPRNVNVEIAGGNNKHDAVGYLPASCAA